MKKDPNNLSPSTTELPEYLESVNEKGRYDKLIDLAKKGYFHDYKFDQHNDVSYSEPKTYLVSILSAYPELTALRSRVINGDFDDQADEEDQEKMRGWLQDEPGGAALIKKLGLEKK